jgi:DNA-binding NtrC family response regulator
MSVRLRASAVARVLVVDDDELVARTLSRVLRRRGFQVTTVLGGHAAIETLERASFELMVLDLSMPSPDGWEVLTRLRTLRAPPPTVVVSACDDLSSAVRAMRSGALDFIPKPTHLDELVARIERALDSGTLAEHLRTVDEDDDRPVAQSGGMLEALALADRVASTPDTSALILGESGVGKEVIAGRIHERSARRNAPFLRVNLSAIPETMVEAELFGSVKGAFTGANRDRAGLLAAADGGTLLLDELGEFDISLQPKLLRVLEEREYHPVGSDRSRSVDVRLIAATNREPEQAIASGRLREDLFFRVSTVVIHVPPLRERRDDIMPLAKRFARQVSVQLGRPAPSFEDATADQLQSASWPGNVRQLRNAVERAVILCDGGTLEPGHFALGGEQRRGSNPARNATPGLAASDDGTVPSLARVRGRALEEAERAAIKKALTLTGGSQTRAAEMLGVSRTTLWSKLKRYGLALHG